MARWTPGQEATQQVILRPYQQMCKSCGGVLWVTYRKIKSITTPKGFYDLTLVIYQCKNSRCQKYRRRYRKILVSSNTVSLEQSRPVESFRKDLASSNAAHTAQLTLVSILLGVIVGALVKSLPFGFTSTLWTRSHLDLDLRVLATFLAAVDLWIKYSWGIIVIRWPFSLAHNVTYTLVCLAMLGLALSVGDLNAWLLWGFVTCLASFGAYMVNLWIAYRENRRKATYPQEKIISDDQLHTPEELGILKETSIVEAFSILIPPAFLGLYQVLNSNHVLYAWFPWSIPFLPDLGWGGFVTFFVVIDILYQGLVAMPRQRYV